jgi:WD40 repeat protein
MAFSANGRDLIAASEGGLTRWDAATGDRRRAPLWLFPTGKAELVFATGKQPRVELDGHVLTVGEFAALRGQASVAGVAGLQLVLGLSADGRALVTAADWRVPPGAKTVTLRDAATGKERAVLPKFQHDVEGGAFGADGKTLVTWADGVVTWDLATGKELDRFEPPHPVLAVRFAADGKTLSTLVLADRRQPVLYLWDVATGETTATLRGHTEDVRAVAFSPDGRLLATSGMDRTVRLWDAVTGQPRGVLRGHPEWTQFLAFRPDGKALAAASYTGDVSLWVAGED